MFNLRTFLFWALTAGSLCHGSLAEDSEYVCFIDEQDSDHSDSIGINELRPLLEEVVKRQIRDADNETKTELDKLQGIIKEVETKLKGQLQEVKTTIEDQQKLLTNIDTQLRAILKKMDAPQESAQAVLVGDKSSVGPCNAQNGECSTKKN